MSNNPFQHGSHSAGFEKPKTAQEVDEFHRRSDVDASDKALHHTLGFSAGQAMSGALLKKLAKAGAFGRVGDFVFNNVDGETALLKKANGQILNIKDYPEAFAIFGAGTGDGVTTFSLPDLRGHVLAYANSGGIFITTVGTKYGELSHNLAHSHTHTGHTHTGPSHSHSITGEASGGATWVTPNTGTNSVPRMTTYNGHSHGGVTGAEGTGNTGSTADTTNGTTFTTPSFGGIYGNAVFSQVQPTYASRIYVRVKLGF